MLYNFFKYGEEKSKVVHYWNKLQQETKLLKEGNILVVDNLITNGNDFEVELKETTLLEKEPTTITGNRWADWENENNKIYFGIINKEAAESKLIKGNNGVLGLYTDNIERDYKKCLDLNVKVLYEPEEIPNSKDNYKCFAIEDLDGNKIEISYYDR